jgi:hypothetical protein
VCDGEEKHSHYQLSTGKLVYHTHKHTANKKEFNRLHHHDLVEHYGFTPDQLEKDYEELDVPF